MGTFSSEQRFPLDPQKDARAGYNLPPSRPRTCSPMRAAGHCISAFLPGTPSFHAFSVNFHENCRRYCISILVKLRMHVVNLWQRRDTREHQQNLHLASMPSLSGGLGGKKQLKVASLQTSQMTPYLGQAKMLNGLMMSHPSVIPECSSSS